MNEKLQQIVEKIKSMDRKTLIGIGVGAVVVIVAIIVLVVALTGNKPASVDGTEGTETATEAATETLFETVDGTETTETTEMDSTETTELEEGEAEEPKVVGGGGTVNGVEQLQVVVNPETGEEMMGAGSASQPYEVIPDLSNMTVTTAQIPAGKTVYYKIQRIGGMYCTINDASAYVISASGTRYNPNGGTVSFMVQDALSSDYVTLQIGNSGSTAKSFVLQFSNPLGTNNNPKVLSTGELTAGVSTSLSAGDDDGYFYKYTAEASGTMTFTVTGCSASTAAISVTNTNSMAQRTVATEGVQGADGLWYFTIDVNAGDVLQIVVGVEPQNWSYPAATITWRANY